MRGSKSKAPLTVQCPCCRHISFACACGERVSIEDVVDIFHVGRCPSCRKIVDTPCPKQLDEQEVAI